MPKPVISSFNTIAPILIQQYERYLPSAFDDGMTMLEKVNKVIEYMNQIGELNNGVVEQWNEVMEWVMNEGLTEDVNNKLDEMVNDGILEQLINVGMIGSLANLKTIYKNDLVGAVNDTTNDLIGRSINVKYPFGTSLTPCKVDGITDDTVAFNAIYQYAFDNGLSVHIPDGKMLIKGKIGLNVPLTENRAFPTISGNKATSVPAFMTDSVIDGSAIIVDGVGVNGLEIINTTTGKYFYGGVIRDIAIIKNNSTKATDGSIGLSLYGCIEYRLYNVSVMGFDVGFKNEWGWSWDIFGLTVVHNNIGFLLDDNSNACGLNGVEAHQNNIGGKILSGSNINIDRITLEGQNYGIVIASGSSPLVPNSINMNNIYTESNNEALFVIGKDENGVIAKKAIQTVSSKNITINATSKIPIQLDNVNGVSFDKIHYQNSIPLLEITQNTFNVTTNPVNNYETIIGGMNAISNRIGIKNKYNLIPNGLIQFPNIRTFNRNTGWVAEFDETTFSKKVVKLSVPTGVTSNVSTQWRVKVDPKLAGRRIVFKSTCQADINITATWSVYDSSMVSLGQQKAVPTTLGEAQLSFICPSDGFIIALVLTNNSGVTKNIYVKDLVAVESGVGEICTSPMDYLHGLSGRVSATTTGVTVPIEGYASGEDYNVFLSPYQSANVYVTKTANDFTIYSDVDVNVSYLIVPQVGMFT